MTTHRLPDFSPCRDFIPYPGLANSHGIISFADPHILNPVESHRYENLGGKGASPSCRRSDVVPLIRSDVPLSPLSATLTRMPLSVHSKRLTGNLTPLDATLTKKRGEEGVPSFKPESFLSHQHAVTGSVTCPEDVHPPYYWSRRTLPANSPRATFLRFPGFQGLYLQTLS
jgi:hypothetical protein